MTRELYNRPLNTFAALVVQDAIFRSEDWSHRITQVSEDFVVVRFPDAIENLVRCCSRFDTSIAFVDKSLFESITPPVLSALARSGVRPIVRIDGGEPSELLERLILQGCHGFVPNGVSLASLRRVLGAVSAGEIAATRRVLSHALARVIAGRNLHKLSRREQEVIALLGKRLSNKSIAQELFISEETLRWHLRNLYTKTDLETRGELVEYAASTIQRNGGPSVAAVTGG